MSAEFSVDLDELDQLVARLSGLGGFVAEQLDQVDDKVYALSGVWEGVAAQAYQDAHSQWSVGAREFAEGVQSMSDAAKRIRGRYNAASEANMKMLEGD